MFERSNLATMSRSVLLFLLLHNFISFTCCLSHNFIEVIPVEGDYNTDYTFSINNTVEYIFQFNKTDYVNPSRVTVSSYDARREHPVLVVVRQQKAVISWQLPLLVDTQRGDLQFYNTSRTLCPDNMNVLSSSSAMRVLNTDDDDNDIIENRTDPIVSISTSSPKDIDFVLRIKTEQKFYITHSVEYTTNVTPSTPKIFFYKFADQPTNGSKQQMSDFVVLRIDSDDDVCMYASVQNSSCPVYDLEHDIRFEGFWETVNRRGGMTVPRFKFPDGFFVVFVSKSEDYECTGYTGEAGVIQRHKRVRFSIHPSITYGDYIIAVTATVCTAALFCVTFWLMLCICSRGGRYRPMTMDAMLDDQLDQPPRLADVSTPTSTVTGVAASCFDEQSVNSSMDETEYDTITEADFERNIIRTKSVVFVHDLARKDPRILKKKSYLYLWHVMTVAVFYGLPVVQLVVTYQRVLSDTGNQDLCYYNFLCAHPLGLLSDFNHVFSNVGYVLLGLLFLLLVNRRERMHSDTIFDRHYGIPQHYGLFYAMGVALIMEGLLSASYHVCPNHSNFQFDSSFMYVMAVLCMVKIYQNRHPDINATAYATFGVLAAAICLGMIGILAGTVYFWVTFTVIHIVTCLLLTVQIYYMGCWNLDRGILLRIFRTIINDFRSGALNVVRPVYKGRMVMLVIGNVCNWALAVLGLYHHDVDFATYLLAIFMSNTLLYTLFYIVMKLCYRERIEWQAVLFIVLATLAWGFAMYFFRHKSISWALTAAESRRYNQPCKLFDFYDPHDIWHFLSAAAMFFSFMILLTLDDDLTHIHRSKIHVF